jgi:hypothetical protein
VETPASGRPAARRAQESPPRVRRRRHRRAPARVLRQPVRAHVPAVRALRRRTVGAGGRRSDRPGQRRPRPGDGPVRRDEQRRTEPHQDPVRAAHGIPGCHRGPLPRRPPALRVPPRRRRPASQPRQGGRRAPPAHSGTRPGDRARGPADLRRVRGGQGPVRDRRGPDRRRDPQPIRPRPGAQPAPLRAGLVHGRRPSHPHQPPLHRPAGLEQAAQGRGPHRRRRPRPPDPAPGSGPTRWSTHP